MWRAICVILLGSFFDYTCAAVHYDNWAWDESPHDLPNGSFLYPRQHPITFLQFSLVNISWNTTYEYTDISCYQLETSWYFPLKSVARTDQQWYIWNATAGNMYNWSQPLGLVASHYDSLGLVRGKNNFTSPQFYVTNRTDQVDMRGGGMVASSTTSQSNLQLSPGMVDSSTSTPTGDTDGSIDHSSDNNKLTPKSAIGITVAVVVGSVLMFVGVYIFLHQRKRRNTTQVESDHSEMDERIDVETHNYHAVPRNVPQETEANMVQTGVAELSAERRLPNVEDLDELVVERSR